MICNGKYKAFPQIEIQNRMWPSKTITHAPVWCSVDLRDGNQALINPMGINAKIEFFNMLVKLGFKEIEVGFPSASETEYRFIRRLIDEKRIPDDVTIQVLCQAREDLVARTFECIKGASNVIFHIYNSTSPAQRKYTFNKSREEIKELAVNGIRCIKKYMTEEDYGRIRLEYSPESFSMTEIDYAVEICEAVKAEWHKSCSSKIIMNLPATVECSTPNVFADRIEYFCTHISDRENVIVSVHNHNDRGEGIASCELSLLAGADRVEGCLFGNGERTGNLDIVTVALNMFSEGIDPQLNFSNLPELCEKYTVLTGMEIPPRMPYAGELVFTAFSGGHQDAIRKGIAARVGKANNSLWDVPYLLIDPHDIGRQYEGIIRINSQSGKGGAAYILEHEYNIECPKAMHPVLGKAVTSAADKVQRELQPYEVYRIFETEFLKTKGNLTIIDLASTHLEGMNGNMEGQSLIRAVVLYREEKISIGAKGNGPLDAFANALAETPVPKFSITAFHEHSVGTGNNTEAMAYVQITLEDCSQYWGVGKSTNIGRAGVDAVVSAINQIP